LSKSNPKSKISRRKRNAIIAVAVCAVLLIAIFLDLPSQPSVNVQNLTYQTNWTSLTSNYNNTRFQYSGVTASNVGTLTKKWEILTNSSVTSTPVVMNGNVYFADWNGNLYSANIVNGSINWKVNLGNAISSTPNIYNGLIYVGFGPYDFTQVDAISQKNGSVVWNTTLNSTERAIWGSPTIFNGLLYIGVAGAGGASGQIDNNASKVGQLYALNAQTGKVDWVFNTLIGTSGGGGVWSSAVVDPKLNSIYFGSGNAYVNTSNALYAYGILSLNATNGKLNWVFRSHNTIKDGDDYDFGATPNLFTIEINNTIYQAVGDGSKDGDYYIVNRLNGVLLKKFQIGTGGASQGIIGLSGFIYQGNNSPELFIPSYYNISNYSCCGIVDAVNSTASKLDWQFFVPANIRGSVTVIPGAVLFGDNSGDFYAVSTANGDQLFYSNFKNSIASGITVAEGYVLVPTSLYGNPSSMGLYAFYPR
jgi:polyvinyl alcohol dehydrogenase (cytochrome)